MLGMHGSTDADLGAGLLEIDGPLDIPHDVLYNRGGPNISGSFLSEEQDARSERVHAQIMSELNEVCDMESQTSKHKRPLENAHSSRSRKSSRSQEETSIGMDDNGTIEACGERSATVKSPVQPVRPKHLCNECGKTFKRAHNLKIHGRLHSGDKPYGCPFPECTKEFRWKSSIVSHMNWHRTKKGDVLPGNFADMHALILKKKKNELVEQHTPLPKQEPVPVPEQGEDEFRGIEKEDEQYDQHEQREKHEQQLHHEDNEQQGKHDQHDGDVGRNHEAGAEISPMVQMGDMSPFAAGLSAVDSQYEEDVVEKEEKDDATVLTPSTTSYQASPAAPAMEMSELDCLPVLDVKEWETRSEGCRSGLSGVLLPSLSCCRIENEGDGFGSFLEEN